MSHPEPQPAALTVPADDAAEQAAVQVVIGHHATQLADSDHSLKADAAREGTSAHV